jgi:hypothetical protein
MNHICDQCGNITDDEVSKCVCCGSCWFSDFSKEEVVCSKCDVIIENGWSCKWYDGSVYCLHCDT